MNKKIICGLSLLSLGLQSAYSAIISIPAGVQATQTWTSGNEYVLEGTVRFPAGTTLTIQGGTVIRNQPNDTGANSFNPGVLVIQTGAKIIAQGSSANPIIFTTAAVGGGADPTSFSSTIQLDGSGKKFFRVTTVRAIVSGGAVTNGPFWDANPKTSPKDPSYSGLGGGVVILGKAINNFGTLALVTDSLTNAADPATVQPQHLIEGFANLPEFKHGGNDDNDNSGVFSFVSIRHQGASLLANNELNGLGLGSVGRGTKIDHIEIWGDVDDGIEVWGGTVNLSNILIASTKDDGLDIDLGWRGFAQFVCVIGGADSDKLSEIDGDDFKNDSGFGTPYRSPYQTAQVWNSTFIGYGGTPSNATANAVGEDYGAGFHNRRGSAVTFANCIVDHLSLTDAFTGSIRAWLRQQSDHGGTFKNVIVNGNSLSLAGGNDSSGAAVIAATTSNIFASDPGFANLGTWSAVGANFTGGSFLGINPLPFGDDVGAVAAQPGGLGLQSAEYNGAFDPGFLSLWTDGWTAASVMGRLSASL